MPSLSLRDSICGYRFYDPAAVGIESDRESIIPLTSDEAAANWNRHVSRDKSHLADRGSLLFDDTQGRFLCVGGWGKVTTEQQTAGRLNELALCDKNESAIVFWDATTAVRVPWHTFVRFWHVFFYPSDDSGVVIGAGGKPVLKYVEDRLYVFNSSASSPTSSVANDLI